MSTNQTATLDPTHIQTSDMLNAIKECQFQSWYKTFRGSKMNSTPRSIIISLPAKFIEYLLSDGVCLPLDATKVSSCVDATFERSEDDFFNDDDKDGVNNLENDSHNDEDENEEKQYSFPELTETITQTISTLGGSVFPKLNWSSPKDAAWMNGGSLKCKTAGDVYLLLKSSDFIVHDLTYAWETVSGEEQKNTVYDASNSKYDSLTKKEYVLILRKWCNLHRSMEFRCFVTSHQLVAISQRDHTQYYPHLQSSQNQIHQKITTFFETIIRGQFAGGSIPDYVVDCYIDKDDKLWIIDFNIWGERTDSLLYTWEELEEIRQGIKSEDVFNNSKEEIYEISQIRLVDGKNEVYPDPLSSYRAPIDTVDLASNSFKEFMSMCEKPTVLDD